METPYLNRVSSPQDIKTMSTEELKSLAEEMRYGIIHRTNLVGGHFGPDLGIVEATIALHVVFDSPKDKMIFDVSHQCYPHKMLTGRKDGYLDPKNHRITGYTSPQESEHDLFTIGHTSTSVSLACGVAKARDLKGEAYNVIAIIGDGSLSGGEALEGLSAGAVLGGNLIVVVNDNEMSIAENHGGIYKNLRKLRESNGECEHNWFKSWGFEYCYLEEGNDVEKLIEVFRSVKDTDKPTVVHIHTEKGHGFQPAVDNKEGWHWGNPFNPEDGSRPEEPASESYEELFSNWMLEEINEFLEADEIVEQADAMIDLMYFAIGTLVEMGVKPDALWQIVQDANMAKLWSDGKPHHREDGKTIKPPTWEDPHDKLLAEIQRQQEAE